MDLQELKDAVVKVLMMDHDFLMEEAEQKVDEHSRSSESEMWNENADASQLAEYLASDESDE